MISSQTLASKGFEDGARCQTRTGMLKERQILSLLCLPFHQAGRHRLKVKLWRPAINSLKGALSGRVHKFFGGSSLLSRDLGVSPKFFMPYLLYQQLNYHSRVNPLYQGYTFFRTDLALVFVIALQGKVQMGRGRWWTVSQIGPGEAA